jgi:hypothetical protein
MAKAVLEFDLNDRDDEERFKLCSKVIDICLVVWDTEQMLREYWKYKEDKLTGDQYKIVEEIRDEFYNIMERHKYSTDECS